MGSVHKGKAFERLVAARCREVLGEGRRGIGQARSASEVPDVEITGWWVECKHRVHVQVRAALEQAVTAEAAARAAGAAPRRAVAITRDNGRPILATLHLDDFLGLLARIRELESSTSTLPPAAPIPSPGESAVVG